MSFKETISQDLWIHIGALIAIAIGVADHFLARTTGFGPTADLMFVIAGTAGLGLKIANGSALALRTTAATAVTAVAAQAASAVTATAAQAASEVTATAAHAATDLTTTAAQAAAPKAP